MNVIKAQFPISEVTVYPAGAMITRTNKLRFEKGENRILIKNLPESLSVDTIRIETGSAESFSITDLSVEDSFIETYDENKYRTSKAELETLVSERKRMEAAYKNFNDEFLLFLNKESLVESIKKDNFRSINVKNWSEFFTFLENQLDSNRSQARETVFRWLELSRTIEAAEANLATLVSYDKIKEHTVSVTIEAVVGGEQEVSVKYMAQSVSWYPAYTIRADVDQKEISVTLFGMVSQSTGEDWNNITLHLSTAMPLSNCDVPELKSFRIKERDTEIEHFAKPQIERAAYEQEKLRIISDSDVSSGAGFAADSSAYKDKKADLAIEEINAPTQFVLNRRSTKESKKKAGAPPMAKSVAQKYAPGSPVSIAGSVSGEVSSSMTPYESTVPMSGGLDAIESLTNKVLNTVLESLPMDRLVRYYGEYGSYKNAQFVPEDVVPESRGSTKANPAFIEGVSPLVSMGGFDYRYRVPGKIDSIPSSGTPVQIGVDIARFPLEQNYVAVPIENESVYLKAFFRNTYSNPFPQGPAQVFSGNSFLCNIMFPTVGRNERASLSLGTDRDIKIIRKEETKRKTGGFIKKEIVSVCTVQIELVSYKDEDVDVLVYERIPISEKPREVEIFASSFTPEPMIVTARKIAIFRIRCARRDKSRISISYSVKHPEDYRLTIRNADHPHYDSEGGAI